MLTPTLPAPVQHSGHGSGLSFRDLLLGVSEMAQQAKVPAGKSEEFRCHMLRGEGTPVG